MENNSNNQEMPQTLEHNVISRVFSYSRGQQKVTIGDIFNWDGVGKGMYQVIKFGNESVYSPSGLGGTSTVWLRNEKGEKIEWCGDSVASGISNSNLKRGKESYLIATCLTEPILFTGSPIYYKLMGVYGYLIPFGGNVLFFYSDSDGNSSYDEPEGWFFQHGL
jgi:hypothetical protein